MIKQAAMKFKNGSVLLGRRHPDIVKNNPEVSFKPDRCTEGFVTEGGVFLDRKEAGRHAYECGQVKEPTDYLKSEDLW